MFNRYAECMQRIGNQLRTTASGSATPALASDGTGLEVTTIKTNVQANDYANATATNARNSVTTNPQDSVAEWNNAQMTASNKQNTQNTPSAQDFASVAMSILQDVPASALVSHDEREKGTSAMNAKTLVNNVDTATMRVTFDDTQTWTYTRKSGNPTEGTWKEAQTAIKQAATTTEQNVYVQRPTRGNVEIKLHNVTVDPMNAAKVIVQDASVVKRLGAKGMKDSHRNMIANMQAYLAKAIACMSDEQREQFTAYVSGLNN